MPMTGWVSLQACMPSFADSTLLQAKVLTCEGMLLAVVHMVETRGSSESAVWTYGCSGRGKSQKQCISYVSVI